MTDILFTCHACERNFLVSSDDMPETTDADIVLCAGCMLVCRSSAYALPRATWDEATIFRWRKGDLLFVDNYLVAHGRNSYSGDRLLLVAMG